MKWIHVEEYGFYCFKESYDPNTPFKKINIKRYVNQEGSVGNMSMLRLFEKTGQLSKEKKENLKEQLPFIPEEYRWYYTILINEGPHHQLFEALSSVINVLYCKVFCLLAEIAFVNAFCLH